MATFQKTYWASNGRFQAMAEHLAAALPQYGAVKELPNLENLGSFKICITTHTTTWV